MSWDAMATVTTGWKGEALSKVVHDQNYTGNCNPMIRLAGWPEWPNVGPLSSPAMAGHLGEVIAAMEAEPARFEALNPENGWGDYRSLLDVLRAMRIDALLFRTATWEVHS